MGPSALFSVVKRSVCAVELRLPLAQSRIILRYTVRDWETRKGTYHHCKGMLGYRFSLRLR